MTAAPSSRAPVDVVIATRNRPELVRVALASVRAQDYEGPVTTYVVHDQVPPDRELVSQEPRRRVVVLRNGRTPGLAGARNSGILAGAAPYVAFCDDDDSWLPGKVAAQVASLESSGRLTSVSGIRIHYGEHVSERVPRPEELDLPTLVRRRVMAAHPSTVVVRREALLGPIGLVDEAIPGSHGEDYDWILRAVKAGPVAVVPQALTQVLWGQSMFSQKWGTILAATDYLLAKHPEFEAHRPAAARLYGQKAFALAALGRRREAVREIGRTLRANPAEPRAAVAALVVSGVVSAARVMDAAHRRGRGI